MAERRGRVGSSRNQLADGALTWIGRAAKLPVHARFTCPCRRGVQANAPSRPRGKTRGALAGDAVEFRQQRRRDDADGDDCDHDGADRVDLRSMKSVAWWTDEISRCGRAENFSSDSSRVFVAGLFL